MWESPPGGPPAAAAVDIIGSGAAGAEGGGRASERSITLTCAQAPKLDSQQRFRKRERETSSATIHDKREVCFYQALMRTAEVNPESQYGGGHRGLARDRRKGATRELRNKHSFEGRKKPSLLRKLRKGKDSRRGLILGHSSSGSAHENGRSRFREKLGGCLLKKFKQNWPHTLVRPEKNFVLN